MFQANCFTGFLLIDLFSRLFPAALVFLILIALSNYAMMFFSCWGLHTYGPWLSKYHKADLWLHRVLVSARKSTFTFFNATNSNIFFPRLCDLHCCFDCRFRMALPYTQHGQLLHPWSTWTLCLPTMQRCPQQRLPPFRWLF